MKNTTYTMDMIVIVNMMTRFNVKYSDNIDVKYTRDIHVHSPSLD